MVSFYAQVVYETAFVSPIIESKRNRTYFAHNIAKCTTPYTKLGELTNN